MSWEFIGDSIYRGYQGKDTKMTEGVDSLPGRRAVFDKPTYLNGIWSGEFSYEWSCGCSSCVPVCIELAVVNFHLQKRSDGWFGGARRHSTLMEGSIA